MKSPFRRFLAFLLACGLAHGAASAQDEFVEGEVLVTFKRGFTPAEASAALDKHALRFERRFDRISRNRVTGLVKDRRLTTAALIARLKSDPRVEIAEPDYIRRVTSAADDPDFSKLWAFENTGQRLNGTTGSAGVDVRFRPAWKMNHNTEAEIVVGVIDTGMDVFHPDLAANIWTNPAEVPGNGRDDDGNGHVDDVHGYDFALNTGVMTDSSDHGTHVAGTIAAVGGNGLGVVGIDRHAKILPLKVSTDGTTMRSSAVIAAMNYSVALKQRGVNIVAINASYGGSSFVTAERNAIQALRDAGIILVAAAGNDGENNDTTPIYPASYTTSNIISVAAINQNNGLSSFSNFGATSVDLAAPGSNIYSTIPLTDAATTAALSVAGTSFGAAPLTFSPVTSGVAGSVHHCGLGNPGDFPAAVSGNIALIQRGEITFADKVTHAMNAGAAAVIIYDNTADALPAAGSAWTLSSGGNWLPTLQVTRASGESIIARLPASATLSLIRNPALAYRYQNGTSMAAPCVTGAVAFAARNFPGESMAQRIARILHHTKPVSALAGKTTTGGRLDLLRIIDTDADGLPDWWETLHFGTLAHHGSGDFNGDGTTNLSNFLNGTDPTVPASPPAAAPPALTLSTLEVGASRRFALTFPTVAGEVYHLEWSATLADGSWQPLGNPVTGTGSLIQIVDPSEMAAQPSRFYRLARITR